MATGKASDFVIYQEQYYGGMYESIAQNVGVFNNASLGAITMVAKQLKGDYNKESFLQAIANLITRRDTTSVAAVTDLAMTQAEFIGVKVNRKIGPVAQTLDAWRKIGSDAKEMSYKLGKMVGENKMLDYCNTAIKSLVAGISGQANLLHDYSATGTVTHSVLVDGLAKMGDRAGSIVTWVMHSKVYFDLVKQAIADKVYEVAGVTIYNGTVATLGRPTIVLDAPDLYVAGTPDKYYSLGLVQGACVVTESEQEEILSQLITGQENIIFRIQGEYAFNINLKGFQWDVTNGGAGPTDAALATTTNWDKIATSDKDLSGVAVFTQ